MAAAIPENSDPLHLSVRAAEEKWSAVADLLPVGVAVSEADTGRIVEVNDTFVRLSGHPREKLEDATSLELGLWEDPDRRDELVRRVMEEGEFRDEEAWYRDASGRRGRVVLSCSRLDHTDGDLLLWTALDVTERVERERFLSTIAENLPGVLYRCRHDRDWSMEYISPGVRVLVGYEPDEFYGEEALAFASLIHSEDRRGVWEEVERALEEERPFQLEYRIRTRDGEEKWVWEQGRVVKTTMEEEERLEGYIVDITPQKEAEEWGHLLESSVKAARYGIVVTDRSGTIRWANPAMEEISGYGRDELEGENTRILKSGEHGADYYRELWEAILAGKVWEGEIVNRRKDGSLYTERQSIVPVRHESDEVTHFVALKEDVSEKKRLEAELRHQALHDPLTGLANRNLLEDRLRQALAAAARRGELCALIMMDLNRFKRINDSLGHTAGDRVLEKLGARLRGAVRQEDTVARWGGDEFCLLLTGLRGPEDLRTTWERLQNRVHQPMRIANRELTVQMSAGAVLTGSAEEDRTDVVRDAGPADLIRYADRALRQAKRQAGVVFSLFDPAREGESDQFPQLRREQDLRRGLEAGEFEPFYQPIVRLDTGRIFAVEPLARWRHPERGLVSPGEFIPLAEEVDLIHDLGRRILKRSCGDVAGWNRSGFTPEPIRVAPNVSGRQFESDDFVEHVVRCLEDAGLDPTLLALEITESALLRATVQLEELREAGAQVWVDDFGTGYSSLLYVRDLNVDGLKIDLSFVQGLGDGKGNTAIVETILTLGQELGLGVVAEGIETRDQLRRLRSMGCVTGQGYLFSRPVPADRMAELLADPPAWAVTA